MKRLLLLGFACLSLSGCVVAQPQPVYAPAPGPVVYSQPGPAVYAAPVYVEPSPVVVEPVFGGYRGGYYGGRGRWR